MNSKTGAVPIKRLRILVSGRVQGVWYRGAMREQAERLGLAGWVKNLPDGRVEAVVEGSAQDLDAIVAWCGKGPPAARVSEVVASEEVAQGLSGFSIAY